MIPSISCTVVLVLCFATTAESASRGRFMQSPDIRGNAIVFTYEGDLWSVPSSGGQARRLTSHPGLEDSARISPDGKTIAFAGNYDGRNIYVMPIEGGSPRRVTWFG